MRCLLPALTTLLLTGCFVPWPAFDSPRDPVDTDFEVDTNTDDDAYWMEVGDGTLTASMPGLELDQHTVTTTIEGSPGFIGFTFEQSFGDEEVALHGWSPLDGPLRAGARLPLEVDDIFLNVEQRDRDTSIPTAAVLHVEQRGHSGRLFLTFHLEMLELGEIVATAEVELDES